MYVAKSNWMIFYVKISQKQIALQNEHLSFFFLEKCGGTYDVKICSFFPTSMFLVPTLNTKGFSRL